MEDEKIVELESGPVAPRLANHPDCIHEWRLLRWLTDQNPQFYCVKCLLMIAKVMDISLENQIKHIKQSQKEWDDYQAKKQNESK